MVRRLFGVGVGRVAGVLDADVEVSGIWWRLVALTVVGASCCCVYTGGGGGRTVYREERELPRRFCRGGEGGGALGE